jgi:hypothetical protein
VNKRFLNRLLIVAFVGYIALVALVAYGMTAWRQSLLTNLTTPEAQSSWNEWRAEAAREDGTHGPVQRTVPKSPEPPSLVLMRDYFPACLAGLLIPLSALYGFIAWLALGIARQST